jgi:hypothetical protein
MRIILAICILFNVIIEDYKQFFANGLAAYNNNDFNEAVDNFTKSYNLKKHSKTSYYMAISYFKMGNDSLAEKFALRAKTELPILPDEPYQQNINHIFEFCELAPRFKKVRFKLEQSNDVMTDAEEKEQKQMDEELRLYYSKTPEGQSRLFHDRWLVQSRSLINEKELQLNLETGQFYQDTIIDALEY